MRTIYLDNNIVLDLQRPSPGSQEENFLRHAKAGKFKVALSSTHHLEAARTKQDEVAYQTADLLDSLSPFWLRKRTELQKRELQAYLNGTPSDITIIDPICHSVSEMASEVAHLRGYAAIMSSKEIVQALRKHPESQRLLKEAYERNARTFRENAADLKAGRATVQQLWDIVLTKLGAFLGLDSSRLKDAKQVSFRAITSEFLVTAENWSRAVNDPAMAMSEQRLCDALHLAVALPYVNAIVSRDKGFIGLATAIKPSCPIPIAPVFYDLKDAV